MLTETLNSVTPLTLAVLVLVLVLTWVFRTWTRTPHNLPPFPVKPYPILGHLPYFSSNPRTNFKEWKDKAGEIYSVYLGSTLVIVFNSYQVMKDTLIKQADHFSDRPVDFISEHIADGGKGIVSASGPNWKEQRTVSMSILRNFGMGKKSLAENIQEEINVYLKELSQLDGKASDVRTLTGASVSNVICTIIVGKRFDYQDKYFTDFLHLFNEQVKLGSSASLFLWFPWLRLLPGDFFLAKRALSNSRQLLGYFSERYIRDTKETFDENNVDNFIVAYLIEQQKKEKKGDWTYLDGQNLRHVIANLFVAGSETTSTTLLWFMLYMLHHPHVLDKMYEEICQVVGTDRTPGIQDRQQLNYVNAAIMETQRLGSIVPSSLLHKCTTEVTVRGYTIPKNATIMPCLDSVLHDQKTWGDPMNFRPERFLDDQGKLMNPEEFVPFSLGRRTCMGESLARMELFLYTANLVQRFDLKPETPGVLPPRESVAGVTCPPVAYKLRFVERQHR